MEAGTLSTEAIRQAEAGRPVLGSVKQVKVTIQESQEFKVIEVIVTVSHLL